MRIKKEFLSCVLIILFVIFLDIILGLHFEKEKDNFEKMIDELQEIIINGEDGKKEIKKLSDKWKNFGHIAAFYTEHNELEKVSLKIAIVKRNIEIEDNEMTIEYLEEVKFWLNHIIEKDKLKLKNIF